MIPDSSWIGSEQIIFTVTEVTSIGHSSSDTAIFTQLRADTPPLLSEIPDQFIGENGNFVPINIQDYVTELDGDSISFNYSYGTYSGTHEQPTWDVDPFDFQYSMSVIASIESRGERAQGNGHVLVAMDGSGVSSDYELPSNYREALEEEIRKVLMSPEWKWYVEGEHYRELNFDLLLVSL